MTKIFSAIAGIVLAASAVSASGIKESVNGSAEQIAADASTIYDNASGAGAQAGQVVYLNQGSGQTNPFLHVQDFRNTLRKSQAKDAPNKNEEETQNGAEEEGRGFFETLGKAVIALVVGPFAGAIAGGSFGVLLGGTYLGIPGAILGGVLGVAIGAPLGAVLGVLGFIGGIFKAFGQLFRGNL